MWKWSQLVLCLALIACGEGEERNVGADGGTAADGAAADGAAAELDGGGMDGLTPPPPDAGDDPDGALDGPLADEGPPPEADGALATTCDQPDSPTCEAAGCVWTNLGCQAREDVHECWRLNVQVCASRPACRVVGDHCEPSLDDLECAELRQGDCAARDDCGWLDDACETRPEGDCVDQDERGCALHPECEAHFEEDACPGAKCPQRFAGCQIRPIPCAEASFEVCEQLPECHVAEVQECVEGGGGGGGAGGGPGECRWVDRCTDFVPVPCEDREAEDCEADELCRIFIDEECHAEPPPGAGGAGGGALMCEDVPICVERDFRPPPQCERREVSACAEDDRCGIQIVRECRGGGAGGAGAAGGQGGGGGAGGGAGAIPPEDCEEIEVCAEL